MRVLLSILICIFVQALIYSMGGTACEPGASGACGQYNTNATINSCNNCTIINGNSGGSISGGTDLSVQADGCGAITLFLTYTFDWHTGSEDNWIHGVTVTNASQWDSYSQSPPNGWIFSSGVSGDCSGASYGAGYYYDGTGNSSNVLGVIESAGMGCNNCFYPNIAGCNFVCDNVLSVNELGPSNGPNTCCVGTTITPSGTVGLSYPSANDGIPSNNWGVCCTTDCPTFMFELTFCPTNASPQTLSKSFTIATSPDGNSGAWCNPASCDENNDFNVTIIDACGPDATFDEPPDDFCNAPDLNLNNVSAGYDSGTEWSGSIVMSPGVVGATFSYCSNLNNTTISHTVGENGCNDGPISYTYMVYKPLIQPPVASNASGCGAFDPGLSVSVLYNDGSGPLENWMTDNSNPGTIVWQSNTPGVPNYTPGSTVSAPGCVPLMISYTPMLNTGCAACDVVGTPISITAYPQLEQIVTNNPANCGTATVTIRNVATGTVCYTNSAACPNPGDGPTTVNYNQSYNAGSPCPFNFMGTLTCNCAGCLADAGTVSGAPSPTCPGTSVTVTAAGYYSDPLYTQMVFIANATGSIVGVASGGSLNYNIPSNAGCGTYTVGSYNYLTADGVNLTLPNIGVNVSVLQSECGVATPAYCCDLATNTITVGASTPLSIACTNGNSPACLTQAAVNAAYASWLTTAATASGGCGTLNVTNNNAVAPSACGGTANVTFTVQDACGTIQTCTASYVVAAPAPSTINTAATSGAQGCLMAAPIAPTFTVTDPCNGAASPTVATTGPTNVGCAYSQTWTASYTPTCGTPPANRVITYTWTQPTGTVTLTTAATSGDKGCLATAPAAPSFTVTDPCMAGATATVNTAGPTNVGCAYTQVWTASYTPTCGTAPANVVVTYTWTQPTGAITINTAATSGPQGCLASPPTAPTFTVTDPCNAGAMPTVATTGPTNVGCAYTQTWTASYTPTCGTAPANNVITYTWTQPTGTVTLTTAATSGDKGCLATAPAAPSFTVTDPCMAGATATVNTSGPTNVGCAYTQVWTASYTPTCGTAPANVVVTYTWTQPTGAITINTAATSGPQGCLASPPTAPTFTVTDPCNAGAMPTVATTGPTNVGCAYTQTWTASYTPTCGTAPANNVITYTWTQPTGTVTLTTTATSGDKGCLATAPAAPSFTVTDPCMAGATATVNTAGPTNVGCAYTQVWTASYTPTCGTAPANVVVTYTWTQPTGAITINTAASSGPQGCLASPPAAPTFTVTDPCNAAAMPTVATTGPTNVGCAYTQTWTASYTPTCGTAPANNVITYTWTQPTGIVTLTTTATSGDKGCLVTAPAAPSFTVTDPCMAGATATVNTSGPTNVGCAYTQIWTASYVPTCGTAPADVVVTYTWTQPTGTITINTTATSGPQGCLTAPPAAPAFTVSDPCNASATATVATTGPTNVGCAYTQTWTASYTPTCGTAPADNVITYTWTQPTGTVTLTTTATSGDKGCLATAPAAPSFTVTDPCMAGATATVNTVGPTNVGCAYTQIWTASYVPTCGTAPSDVVVTYTWTQPTGTITISTTATSGPQGCLTEPPAAPAFTVSDPCNASATATVATTGPTNVGCAYTQTWTASYTPTCGTAPANNVITYTWTQPTGIVTLTTTATSGDKGCLVTAPAAPSFTVTDPCMAGATATVNTAGPTNVGCAYTQIWTASYVPTCGTAPSDVVVTYTWTQPTGTITISTTATSGPQGCLTAPPAAPAFTVSDPCNASATATVVTTGPTNTGCAYTQTWTASYAPTCGTPPANNVITYTWTQPTGTVTLTTTATSGDKGCLVAAPAAPSFTVTDPCMAGATAAVNTSGPTNVGCTYTQIWTASYVPTCGTAPSDVVVTYTWTQPTGTITINTTASSGPQGCLTAPPAAPAFTVSDPCNASATANVTTAGPSNTGCAYTQTWTASYVPMCGTAPANSSITYTWTQPAGTVTLTTTATSGDKGCLAAAPTAPSFIVTDPCMAGATATVNTAGPTNVGCTYTQIWTASYVPTCGTAPADVVVTYTWTQPTGTITINTTASSGPQGCLTAPPAAPAFTVSDPCNASATATVATTGPTNVGCAYTQTWTASYTPTCGTAPANNVITYTWTQPTGTVTLTTTAISGDKGCLATAPAAPSFTVTDPCMAGATATVNTSGPTNVGCAYTQIWTASYVPTCGTAPADMVVTYTWTQPTGTITINTAATSGDKGCLNAAPTAPAFTVSDPCNASATANVATTGPTNVGCAYTQTWTASYTPTCGTAPTNNVITYTWTQPTGTVTLTTTAVSGDKGCLATAPVAPTFTLTDPCNASAAAIVNTAGPTNVGCAYTQIWTASYVPTCGTAPSDVVVTYTWTQPTGAITINTAATSGDQGCLSAAPAAPTFTVSDPCNAGATATVNTAGPTNVGCAYTQTWTASYDATCGIDPSNSVITYTWKNTTTPLTANCPTNVNLPACSSSASINSAYTTWSTSFTNSGGCGTVTVTSGAVPSLPAITCGGTINLSHTYTVSDGCGSTASCTSTFIVTPCPGLTISPTVVNTTCGLNNGSISLAVSGGTPAYSYNWSGGLSGQNPTGVASGTYTVTITDSGTPACSNTATVVVGVSTAVMANLSAVQPTCGQNNGSITVTATGGASPYTYGWDGGLSGQNPTNVPPGTYNVTVTDSGTPGCTDVANITLNNSTGVAVNGTSVNTSCGLDNGSITLNPTGGSGTYTYSWTGAGSPSGANPTGLAAGVYTVTVSDTGTPMCTATETFTINVSTGITIDPTVVNTTCGLNNGSISLAVSGGTPAYSYNWSGGLSGQNPTGVASGTYTVTITDSGTPACSNTATVVVGVSTAVMANLTVVQPSCGQNNGSITVTATGGTSPYTYGWDGGLSGQSPTNVPPGTYNVTVTDSGTPGCTDVANITLNNSTGVAVNGTSINTSCGLDNGSITLNPTGGSGTYTYSWTGAGSPSGANPTGLAAGVYTVTVSDTGTPMCTATQTFTINVSTGIAIDPTVVNTTCGLNNGSISLAVSGGTPAYSYNWSGGLSGQNPTGVTAGTYTVTVTGSGTPACFNTATVVVGVSTAVMANLTVVQPSCGQNNGSITVTATGGTSPYTYGWDGSLSGQNPTNVAPGTYNVTVTDSGTPGCTDVANITLNSSTGVAVNGTSINTSCGLDNGSITLNPTGGSGTYTYSWTGAGSPSGANPTGLAAGVYTVTVSDTGTPICTATQTFTINVSTGITIDPTVVNTTCGLNNGSISLSISGGTPAYSYNWSGSLVGQNPTNVAAGTYTVTVTGSGTPACSNTATVTVGASTGIDITSSITQPSCGSNNGEILVTPSGGVAPYNYNWSNSLVGNNPMNLASGTYFLTVSDSNVPSCSFETSFNVSPSSSLTLDDDFTSPTCGLTNGTITLTVTGGTSPYTFDWSGSLTGEDQTNLSSGVYTVTVSDNSSPSCQIVRTFTLDEDDPIVIVGDVIHTSCGLNNGSINLTLSGGITPYNISWSGILTGSSPNNLAANTYMVTVTDSDNPACSSVASYTVNPSTGISVVDDITPVSCGMTNGAILLNVTGGTGPYTYSWTPGTLSGDSPTGLGAGNYTVTITDGGTPACSFTMTYNVPSLSGLTATETLVQPTCGNDNGEISISVTGGTAPYTYVWSSTSLTGTGGTSLPSGTYGVTITDSGSPACSITDLYTLNPSSAISIAETVSNTTCGNNNGAINLVVTGGNAPYNYAWTGSLVGATPINVAAGTYTVTVTDSGNPSCTSTETYTISPSTGISVVEDITSVSCGSPNGAILLTVTGGTGSYTYAWTPGTLSGDNPMGLSAGNYTVTITDGGTPACSFTMTYNVPSLSGLTSIETLVQPTCGNDNGEISISVTGGTAPYTYAWSSTSLTGTGGTGLASGTYGVTITDSGSPACSITDSYTLNPSSAISIAETVTNTTCGNNNGSINLVVTGGNAPYNYAWTGSLVGATPINVAAGTYTVTVTDSGNPSCTSTETYTINPSTGISVVDDITSVSCGSPNGAILLTVTGGTGSYTYAWTPGTLSGDNPMGLSAGNYTVTITDGGTPACSFTMTYNVPSLSGLMATETLVQPTCGNDNGEISISVTGGTAPYTYAWSSTSLTGTGGTNLASGTYGVTITDSGSPACEITDSYTLNPSSAISIAETVTNTTCGNDNGSINLVVTGGNAPYTYIWSGSLVGATPINVAAGTYTVTVSDSGNPSCTSSETYTINPSTGISVVDDITSVSCGSPNGAILLTVTGGTGSYTYAWTPGTLSGDNPMGLSAGNYTVTITDGGTPACSSTMTYNVPSLSGLMATETLVQTTCGNDNGEISITVTGGTAPYTYAWSSTSLTGTGGTGLASGTYGVTITDSGSPACSITDSYTLNPSSAISIAETVSNTTCGNNNGAINLVVTGGNAPFNYAWTGSLLGANPTNVAAGTYTVTVSDSGNPSCTSTETYTINPSTGISVVDDITPVSCGTPNGEILLTVTGGTGPYTYAWTPGTLTGDHPTGLTAGNYTVTITDGGTPACSFTMTYNVPSLSGLAVTETLVQPTCGNDNGEISIEVTGGTAPYTYTWSSPLVTGTGGTGLPSGTYGVTITDNGSPACEITDSYTLLPSSAINIEETVTNTTCGNDNGSINLVVTGGNAPYNFTWTGSLVGATPINVAAGTYTVTVSDSGSPSCTSIETYTIDPSTGISVTELITSASCGTPNGEILLTVTGGTGTYSYSWTPSTLTGNHPIGLSAGNYTVTISDGSSSACTSVATYNVPSLSGISVTETLVQPSCGNDNGSINIAVTGGTPPYTYTWSSLLTGTGGNNLPSGTYTVTIVDSAVPTCDITETYTLLPSSAISIVETVTNTTCGNNNGAINLVVSGGNTPYTYAWTGSLVGANPTNVAAGTYTVTVSDSSNPACTNSASYTVGGSTGLTLVIDNVQCNPDLTTFNVTVTYTGGVLTASAGTPSGNSIINIPTNEGTVTISVVNTDPACTVEEVVIAPNCDCPTIIPPVGSDVTICEGTPIGPLTVTVGTGLEANWYSTATGGVPLASNTTSFTPTAAGTYYAEAFDPITNCVSTRTGLKLTIVPSANAGNDNSVSICNFDDNTLPTSIDLTTLVSNSGGTFSPIGTAPSLTGTTFNGLGVASGSYQYNYTVIGQAPCPNDVAVITVNVTDCTPGCSIQVSGVVEGTCNDNNTGNDVTDDYFSVSFTAVGVASSTTYNILVNNVAAGTGTYGVNKTLNNIPANGNVIVITIIDSTNPNCTTTFQVDQAPCSSCIETANAGTDQNITCTETSVKLTGTASDPSGIFKWTGPNSWMFTGSSPSVTVAGTYTLTVTFSNQCTATDVVVVTKDANVPSADAGVDQFINCIDTIVTIGSVLTSDNLTYSWVNSQNTEVSTDRFYTTTIPDTYTLIVTDTSNDCKSSDDVTIAIDTLSPNAVIFADPGNILDCSIKSIIVSHSDQANVEYTWYYNQNVFKDVSLVIETSGEVILNAIDTINFCENSSRILINKEIEYPIININTPDALTCTNSTVTIDASNSQNGQTITYQWIDGNNNVIPNQNGKTLIVSEPGTYYLQLIDSENGCKNVDTVVVESNMILPTVVVDDFAQIPCNEPQSVLLSAEGSTGQGSVSYHWVLNNIEVGNTESILVSSSGTYYLEVIDGLNGCSSFDTIVVTEARRILSDVIVQHPTCHDEINGSVEVIDIVAGVPPFTYKLNGKTQSQPLFTNVSSGSYDVVVTDNEGCTFETQVTLINPPISNLVIEGIDSIGLGEYTILEVILDGNSIDTMYWMPTDSLSCPNCTITKANPSFTTTYVITVIDEFGCEVEERVTIFVDRDVNIHVPSVFSPNGDGINDFFSLFTKHPELILDSKVTIYDRWGNLVYNKDGISFNQYYDGWDGKFNAKNVEQGVYVYLIHLTLLGNEKLTLSGDITVLR